MLSLRATVTRATSTMSKQTTRSTGCTCVLSMAAFSGESSSKSLTVNLMRPFCVLVVAPAGSDLLQTLGKPRSEFHHNRPHAFTAANQWALEVCNTS